MVTVLLSKEIMPFLFECDPISSTFFVVSIHAFMEKRILGSKVSLRFDCRVRSKQKLESLVRFDFGLCQCLDGSCLCFLQFSSTMNSSSIEKSIVRWKEFILFCYVIQRVSFMFSFSFHKILQSNMGWLFFALC